MNGMIKAATLLILYINKMALKTCQK